MKIDLSGACWKAVCDQGQIVEFTARIFVCHDCALETGFTKMEDHPKWGKVNVSVERGTFSQMRWYNKGWEDCGDDWCPICGEKKPVGEEIYLTVEV